RSGCGRSRRDRSRAGGRDDGDGGGRDGQVHSRAAEEEGFLKEAVVRSQEAESAAANMSPEEVRAAGPQGVALIAGFLSDAREYPVLPGVAPGSLIDALPKSGPERGQSMDAILEDFRKLIVPGVTQWNHPRFFAYFSTCGSGPGILGEMLAAALNSNHML